VDISLSVSEPRTRAGYQKLITNQDSFDFIHFRSVMQGITKWPQVLQEAYRSMKPGAWIELSETDSKPITTTEMICSD
jgi:ubiquinone/menaquinone biosynthesis C-methylase UbiE